jgi:nitrite reductase (NO-forming)
MLKKFPVRLAMLAVVGLFMVACSTPTLKVDLNAEDIMWDPTTIEAKVNQPIQITIRNEGALDHNLVIEEYEINLLLSPGDVEVVDLTIDHAGTVTYICSIPGHEEAGMVGEIIVTE